MDKFKDRYDLLRKEVELRIKQELARLGVDKVSFANPETEEDVNYLYELPMFVKVTKHGFYCEYGIHTIRKQYDEIYCDGIERGENSDKESVIMSEVGIYSLCDIADRLGNM